MAETYHFSAAENDGWETIAKVYVHPKTYFSNLCISVFYISKSDYGAYWYGVFGKGDYAFTAVNRETIQRLINENDVFGWNCGDYDTVSELLEDMAAKWGEAMKAECGSANVFTLDEITF